MQIETSRGLAPQPEIFTSLYELEPYFHILVLLGLVDTHKKLPDGTFVVTMPPQWKDTVFHVTFSNKFGNRPALSPSMGMQGLQNSITKSLLTLSRGETAFVYGQSKRIIPGRLASLGNAKYRALFAAAPMPVLPRKVEDVLELLAVITRTVD